MSLFINLLFKSPLAFLLASLAVVFSVCCHEYCHARAALWQGDDTAARAGHLTLNPLKQMGKASLLMLAVFGLAWGAVPVNPANFKNKYSELVVSLAGPATNLALFLVFGLLLDISLHFFDRGLLIGVLAYAAELNLVLAFFNLLPVPGLDGGVLIARLLPRLQLARQEWFKGTLLILFVLLFLSVGRLFALASDATNFYITLLEKLWAKLI